MSTAGSPSEFIIDGPERALTLGCRHSRLTQISHEGLEQLADMLIVAGDEIPHVRVRFVGQNARNSLKHFQSVVLRSFSFNLALLIRADSREVEANEAFQDVLPVWKHLIFSN